MFFKQRENFGFHRIIEENERLKISNQKLQNEKNNLQKNYKDSQAKFIKCEKDKSNLENNNTTLGNTVNSQGSIISSQNNSINVLRDDLVNTNKKLETTEATSESNQQGVKDAGSILTGVETFQPFAVVEHYSQDEKSIVQEVNDWVKGQKTIRNDYMNSINGLLSEADTGIQDIYTKAKQIDDYKTRLYLTHVAIRVVAVGIILFLAGFGIKIVIEKSRK